MDLDALVTVVSADSPGVHSARVPIDSTLLDAVRSAGVDMEATCGARGRCRSCRVKVLTGEVPPPTVQDSFQLGPDAVQERFRLACQTRVIGDCKVAAMPPKSESGHQILASGDVAADRRLTLDSGVRKHLVQAKTPTGEHHQTSDVEEILRGLPDLRQHPLQIELLRRAPRVLRQEKGLLTVTSFNGRVIDLEPGDTTAHSYGMAFDIGTTSIVGSLLNLATGEQLASVSGLNPQAQYGGDLMSRIAYAQFDDKKLQTLRGKILSSINEFINQACTEAGVRPDNLYKIVVVGNTCMHHIFLGIDVSYVGLAPYAPVVRDPLVFEARDLPLKAAPHARICMLPIVAGFVGADTMACLLATRLYESEQVRALVDIGTNGEVVMGSRHRLVACSAPAGPALEGAQIRHGMRGAVGAVEKVQIDSDVRCQTIGAAPAIGICGSGLIDACAKMLDAGVLDSNGLLRRSGLDQIGLPLRERLQDGPGGREFVLVRQADAGRDHDISITQADIRQIQLAKSAIYSGIVMLQTVMNVPNDQLAELMLCGGFGNYISVASSVKIRLLPDLPLDRITYMGNAAATGAQMALLSETERLRAFDLARQIEHVALAARPDFQDMFVEGMNFNGEPFPVERRTPTPSKAISAA
ncbi:MAG TPA: ASKHA domain-containing protein [Burkholderiaceae bacterium]|nr:ASKHA domain-containing protein [Burkholderiaceae bacterium]